MPKPKAEDADALAKRKEIQTLWTKFIVSAAFSPPLLYIAMAPMIDFARLPFPAGLDPMRFPLRYALVEPRYSFCLLLDLDTGFTRWASRRSCSAARTWTA